MYNYLNKIQTPKDLKGKLRVYTLFRMTKAGSINNISFKSIFKADLFFFNYKMHRFNKNIVKYFS